ncbi:MAG: S41 family peptidase [Candidatus Krumholzibacteriales bacterium]
MTGKSNRMTPERAELIIAAVCLALLLAGCHSAPAPPEQPGPEAELLTEEQVRLNLQSFDYVWETINSNFWNPEILGLDWKKLGDEYRKKVAAAETMSEARQAMSGLLEELGHSHFGIIPEEAYLDIAGPESKSSTAGEVGITARIRNNKPLVVSVREGSSSAAAGVRPGWEIVSVNRVDLRERFSNLRENLKGKRFLDYSLNASLLHLMTGPPGDTLAMSFMDGSGNEVLKSLPLYSRKGNPHKFGYLPEFYVWLDYSEIDGNIGYISFSSFFDPMHIMPEFNKAVMSFLDRDGIIIDIRGNPGGIGGMAMGMAGWFINERGRYLGKLTTRDSELKLIINPRPDTFRGKVAVLVDEMSTSSSEFLAGGLQAIGAAKVFGTRTPGAALPSVIDRLPNGDAFQYVIGNYTAEDGTRLEGRGVIPDFEITPGREQLLESGDPVLKAAVNWINGNPE